VLRLARSNTFSPADFVLRYDGVCRANHELTRALVAKIVKDSDASQVQSVISKVILHQ